MKKAFVSGKPQEYFAQKFLYSLICAVTNIFCIRKTINALQSIFLRVGWHLPYEFMLLLLCNRKLIAISIINSVKFVANNFFQKVAWVKDLLDLVVAKIFCEIFFLFAFILIYRMKLPWRRPRITKVPLLHSCFFFYCTGCHFHVCTEVDFGMKPVRFFCNKD